MSKLIDHVAAAIAGEEASKSPPGAPWRGARWQDLPEPVRDRFRDNARAAVFVALPAIAELCHQHRGAADAHALLTAVQEAVGPDAAVSDALRCASCGKEYRPDGRIALVYCRQCLSNNIRVREKTIRDLQALLGKYGNHTADCVIPGPEGAPCSCGWAAASAPENA